MIIKPSLTFEGAETGVTLASWAEYLKTLLWGDIESEQLVNTAFLYAAHSGLDKHEAVEAMSKYWLLNYGSGGTYEVFLPFADVAFSHVAIAKAVGQQKADDLMQDSVQNHWVSARSKSSTGRAITRALYNGIELQEAVDALFNALQAAGKKIKKATVQEWAEGARTYAQRKNKVTEAKSAGGEDE